MRVVDLLHHCDLTRQRVEGARASRAHALALQHALVDHLDRDGLAPLVTRHEDLSVGALSKLPLNGVLVELLQLVAVLRRLGEIGGALLHDVVFGRLARRAAGVAAQHALLFLRSAA